MFFVCFFCFFNLNLQHLHFGPLTALKADGFNDGGAKKLRRENIHLLGDEPTVSYLQCFFFNFSLCVPQTSE